MSTATTLSWQGDRKAQKESAGSESMNKELRREYVLLVVSFLGIILSAYAITLHYAPAESSWCHIGETFDCDKVNKSPWSVFFGVPVAILGLAAYLSLFYLVLFRKRLQRMLAFTDNDAWRYLLFFACVMLAFQIYLTLMEAFFIHAYCIVCLTSQLLTIALAACSWQSFSKAK